MRILCVDIGTGTQDIYLFDSRLAVENGFKMVVPSPTMIMHRQLQKATQEGTAVLLTGLTMGGGPSQWAAEAHLRAGYDVFATPDAARSFNDDLHVIEEMGIKVIGEDEVGAVPDEVTCLKSRDFDYRAIEKALNQFGVALDDLDAVAVAVFDHGAAPPNYSDRLFRFDFIRDRLQKDSRLSAFAFPAAETPDTMTRLKSVVESAKGIGKPLIVMDTAPAAILGATFDPVVQSRDRVLIVNIGNLHTLAFRLNRGRVEGVFEHHTGMLDQEKLNGLLRELAAGTLSHDAVFNDHGHGAYIMDAAPLPLDNLDFNIVVTGPRWAMMDGSILRPYKAAPFGDMMLTGCYGLLAATADVLPTFGDLIKESLEGKKQSGVAPWDI